MNKITYALMSLLFTPVNKNQDILICYASQTGTAANLAKQSGDIAVTLGRSAAVRSLSSLHPSELENYNQVLMIVSTCGEGEIPDEGKLFYQQLQQYPALSVPVSLLALGDNSYKHFCLAGILIHNELKRMGSPCEEEPLLVSGNPIDIWRDWLSYQLASDIDDKQIQATSTQVALTLTERYPLHNNGSADSPASEAYHLRFKLSDAVNYKINDLVAITPPGSQKERLYSIASSSIDNTGGLSLCIARHQFLLDGKQQPGLCSDYLINQLNSGEAFNAEIRAGAGMALPTSKTPLILVATGAGIAPMMSMLAERKLCSHVGPNWMIFGHRHSESDFYYQQQLSDYQSEGVISQLDTAFSRDSNEKVYVQDRLREHSEQLADWLVKQDGQVYVCGRPELKDEVLSVISHSLQQNGKSSVQSERLIADMLQNHRIVFELF
ncbi:flavodoxin domain-containing protein [Vibrio sp. SCSIO 43137]|uniref:flavodoxin domain-containing protein n=1 Tax=Vibrio sp. SCSIO 43137 TaxID=3021011 RepID=UPI00230755D9|nr:flavodoxin domain-containing protein [Vibrio sp. SCSIO 43137]WCE31458.1 flavodoxin domain-containing protein [Vibrio sp. SCSIO 43137]